MSSFFVQEFDFLPFILWAKSLPCCCLLFFLLHCLFLIPLVAFTSLLHCLVWSWPNFMVCKQIILEKFKNKNQWRKNTHAHTHTTKSEIKQNKVKQHGKIRSQQLKTNTLEFNGLSLQFRMPWSHLSIQYSKWPNIVILRLSFRIFSVHRSMNTHSTCSVGTSKQTVYIRTQNSPIKWQLCMYARNKNSAWLHHRQRERERDRVQSNWL